MTFSSADDRGHKPPPIGPFPHSLRPPEFSPDGRWIAYQAGIVGVGVGASPQIFVRPFPGPGRAVLIDSRGRNAVWRGQELFYLQRQTPMVVSIDTQPAFHPGQSRVATQPFDYDTGPGTTGFDVSPDGQRFLVLNGSGKQVPNALIQLNVVLHWIEEVKQKIAMGKDKAQ